MKRKSSIAKIESLLANWAFMKDEYFMSLQKNRTEIRCSLKYNAPRTAILYK